jgi:hypothetical protein
MSQRRKAKFRVPRFRRVFVLSALCGLAAACVLPLVSASASSGLLEISSEPKSEAVYATRAALAVEVQSGGLEVKWRGEDATSPNGPWTVTNTGAGTGNGGQEMFLGPIGEEAEDHILHHLSPGTTYYVRFEVEDSAKEVAVSKVFDFTTTAVTGPEVLPPSPSGVEASGPTSLVAKAAIESNGAETKYGLEYTPAEADGQAPSEASSSWLPFSPAGTGTVSVAEGFAEAEAEVTGLAPETKYYVRFKATNEKGTTVLRQFGNSPDGSYTTTTERPIVYEPEALNVTGTSVHLIASLVPHRLAAKWHFEYAISASGPWLSVPDAEGVVSQAEADSYNERSGPRVGGSLTGLKPATTYYVRLFAENKEGEATNGYGEPISTGAQGLKSFETFGAPTASTFAVHGLHGEALHVMGAVNPDSVPTSGEQTITIEGAPTGGTFTLSVEGQTTGPIAYNASWQAVEDALKALSTIGETVSVTGSDGGPYTVTFRGQNGEVAQPQITAEASLIPASGSVSVATVKMGGEGYETHYHFEYVSQKQFEMAGSQGGFAIAGATPEVDLGVGDSADYVGADLPSLEPGETYRFRAVATNTSPGDPVVYGETQSLTVPAALSVAPEVPGACPNEALRTGPSAFLPDCRAFEQLTPVNKEGAQEIFNYGSSVGYENAFAADDGDHFMLAKATTKWGAGQSPYFFARTSSGWQVTAGTAQPTAGIFAAASKIFSPDLSEFGFEAQWTTSSSNSSRDVEFEAGPPGGPYVTVASVPSADAEPGGWVGSSADFSKLVLQVADHSLVNKTQTHTLQGEDLYEYSKGELRQANVTGPGAGVTIGSCGATFALSPPARIPAQAVHTATFYPVSYDGSHVFFEAAPGKDCSEAKHLYVRVNGGSENAETIDLGPYVFVRANREGTEALLEKREGANPGLYLYRSGSAPQFLPSSGVLVETGASPLQSFTVSEDLSTVYIRVGQANTASTQAIYRYDVPAGRLSFLTQIEAGPRTYYASSPDGRYFYFDAETVAGLPGGGQELEQPHAGHHGHTSQVYRYDSAEASIQCMSCASSFDPEPKLSALFTEGEERTVASTDGDYVFFDTPAALLASDVDGEVAPEGLKAFGGEHGSQNYSVSSDVYEWRREGVGGCAHVQGCLALITTGNGGFLNILLGTTSTGDDVFFATKESLLPSDNDTALDIYDARVNGGFPEPARPVECAGDSCSTPFAPPSEVTPSSATFQGAGNQPAASPPAAKGKPKPKPKSSLACKTKNKKKCKTKRGKKAAKKSARGARNSDRGHASTTGGTAR